MNRMLQFFVVSGVVALLGGCASGMIPVYNVHNQPIGRALDAEQIKRATKTGAAVAGWQTQEAGDGLIVATYRIRAHTVIVDIRYDERTYSIDYKNSFEMKVHCTEQEKMDGQPVTVTGRQNCPGGSAPAYIHQNYRAWVSELDTAIRNALSAA